MNILPIKLLAGTHANTGETGQGCFMNVIAYLNGEAQITDESTCVCVTIRPIAIFANDLANDEQRQRLLPFLLRAMGSATDDKTEVSRRLDLLIAFANKQAETAPEYAKYAAESGKYAAEYAGSAAARAKIFDDCIEYLDAALPKTETATDAVLERAKKLYEMAE